MRRLYVSEDLGDMGNLFSSQFYCEPKTTLKIKFIKPALKKEAKVSVTKH